MKTMAFTAAIMALAFAVCFAQQARAAVPGNKILVLYYSWGGNTRTVANQIKAATGGDIFEVVPVKPYPKGYSDCTDQAKKEINANFRPEVKAMPDFGKYDAVFVGSPCWWGTVAPPIATVLTNGKLGGKTIVPFMTHEGSGFGHSLADLKKFCPNSKFLEGQAIRGSFVGGAENGVKKWLKEIKVID